MANTTPSEEDQQLHGQQSEPPITNGAVPVPFNGIPPLPVPMPFAGQPTEAAIPPSDSPAAAPAVVAAAAAAEADIPNNNAGPSIAGPFPPMGPGFAMHHPGWNGGVPNGNGDGSIFIPIPQDLQPQPHAHPINPNNPNQRVHRIHIRAPRGGSLRLNVGGRVLSINPGANGGMMNNIARPPPPARLPPLMPRPLPDSQQNTSEYNENAYGQDDEEEDDDNEHRPQDQDTQIAEDEKRKRREQRKRQKDELMDTLKCAICLEFMRDPCGCGNCQSRFCYSCLSRVATGNSGGIDIDGMLIPPPINNQNGARCPTCRASFDVEDIQRDRDLHHRIHTSSPIPCRYEGCKALVPLDQVAAHEVHCTYIKVHCRYKHFGCQWIGPRGEFNQHETTDCNLAKVATLVQRHRQLQADVTQRLDMFGQNLAANAAMLEHQRFRYFQSYSLSNPWHLLQFILSITCTTPHFLVTRDSWSNLHSSAQARAAVFNFVSMLPTSLLVIKMVTTSYQQLLSYQFDYHHDDDSANSNNSTNFEESDSAVAEEFIDTALAFANMSCLAFLTIVCFYVDGNSSLVWEFFKIPGTSSTQRILLNTIAIALLTCHALAMHFSGSVVRAILVWSFVCISSTVFPAIVISILEAANGISVSNNSTPQQTNSKILSSGRAARPLLFGLRYAPLVASFGIGPCVDAAILVYLARKYIVRSSWSNLISLDNELFLSNASVHTLYFILGIRLGIKGYEIQNTGTVVLDSVLVLILLIITNFALIQFAWAGIQIGSKIASASRTELMPIPNHNGIPILRKDYNGFGMASFCLWMVSLAAIVLSY